MGHFYAYQKDERQSLDHNPPGKVVVFETLTKTS